MKKEDPAFALVAGDLIMGHWGTKREKIDEWANKYYPGWGQRFKDHDLKVYAALGDGVHSSTLARQHHVLLSPQKTTSTHPPIMSFANPPVQQAIQHLAKKSFH
jgi:hypothetical protein